MYHGSTDDLLTLGTDTQQQESRGSVNTISAAYLRFNSQPGKATTSTKSPDPLSPFVEYGKGYEYTVDNQIRSGYGAPELSGAGGGSSTDRKYSDLGGAYHNSAGTFLESDEGAYRTSNVISVQSSDHNSNINAYYTVATGRASWQTFDNSLDNPMQTTEV